MMYALAFANDMVCVVAPPRATPVIRSVQVKPSQASIFQVPCTDTFCCSQRNSSMHWRKPVGRKSNQISQPVSAFGKLTASVDVLPLAPSTRLSADPDPNVLFVLTRISEVRSPVPPLFEYDVAPGATGSSGKPRGFGPVPPIQSTTSSTRRSPSLAIANTGE